MPTSVLVIDHTAKEGGGELALLRVVAELSGTRAKVRALIFEEGPFVARLRSAGVMTAVLGLDPSVNTSAREGIFAPAALLRSVLAAGAFVPRLARAIRSSGAEVVVANSLKAAVMTAVAAPLAGRRWVWHLHDRLASDYLSVPLVALMRALAVLGPRAIVVNSRATLDTLPRWAKRKALIAHPGLPEAAFTRRALPAGPEVVGIVGRISPTKGQREFLSAAAIVARDHPGVRFRVVGAALFGEAEYEAAVRALPAELGIADRVAFTGWIADSAVELRELSVLVHASPVAEPFGQVVVEAMAAGVGVVAADAGGIRDILHSSDATEVTAGGGVRMSDLGLLVRPGDAIALAEAISIALTDVAGREARADAAHDSARRRFAIEATADAVATAWRLDGEKCAAR